MTGSESPFNQYIAFTVAAMIAAHHTDRLNNGQVTIRTVHCRIKDGGSVARLEICVNGATIFFI